MNNQFQSKIKKWGNSYGIVIPKEIIDNFKLMPNDKLDVSFKIAQGCISEPQDEAFSPKLINYLCKKCLCQFFLTKEEIPYCPACDEDNYRNFDILDEDFQEETTERRLK